MSSCENCQLLFNTTGLATRHFDELAALACPPYGIVPPTEDTEGESWTLHALEQLTLQAALQVMGEEGDRMAIRPARPAQQFPRRFPSR